MMDKKKSLGQNFLKYSETAKQIVELSGIDSESIVMEIGPGEGRLTHYIVEKNPKKLTLIELDRRLCPALIEKFPSAEVINKDAANLEINTPDLLIIGNLPYNVSTVILEKLMSYSQYIKRMVFMFQKEVAERISAKVNGSEYGRLSLLAQEFFEIKKLMDLSPDLFIPAPRVDSCVLCFDRLETQLVAIKNRKIYDDLLKLLFSNRRKMLRRTLKSFINNETDLEKLFTSCNIDPSLRPQNLDIRQFAELANYIYSLSL